MSFFGRGKSPPASNTAVNACNEAKAVLVEQLVGKENKIKELEKSVNEKQDKISELTEKLAAMQAAQENFSPPEISPLGSSTFPSKFFKPRRGGKQKTRRRSSRRSTRKQVRGRRS